MRTNPLSLSRGAPGLLLLLDRLWGSPPSRSRTGDRQLPLDQSWSSVFMAMPLFKATSVGMLMALLVGAISWDCQAGEGKGSEKGQIVVREVELERVKWKIRESESKSEVVSTSKPYLCCCGRIKSAVLHGSVSQRQKQPVHPTQSLWWSFFVSLLSKPQVSHEPTKNWVLITDVASRRWQKEQLNGPSRSWLMLKAYRRPCSKSSGIVILLKVVSPLASGMISTGNISKQWFHICSFI